MTSTKSKNPKKTSKPATTKASPSKTSGWFKQLRTLITDHGYKLYPVLFAIFPLLSFYHSNEAEIRSGDFALLPFFIFNLVAVAIIWPVAWLVTRNAKKASILSVLALTIFFAFGRVQDHIKDFVIHTPIMSLGPTKLLFLISAIILLAAWFGLRHLSLKATNSTNLALSLVGAYLVISSLIAITIPFLSGNKNQTQKGTSIATASSKVAVKDLPDIYYILLDGYERQDILKQNFGFDNSAFINGLRQRGFYVADKSHSNYAHTFVSVPSTFNMEYLTDLAEDQGPQSVNRDPLQKLTRYNSVVPTFQSFGYKYVNIGSLWGWTATSPLSDITIPDKTKSDSKIVGIKLDEFALVYLQTTAIKHWISSSIRGTFLAKILGAFEKTEAVSKLDAPTFTFSHMVSPHPPYLFNSKGPIPGLTDKVALDNPGFSDKHGFVEQTIYANKLTLHMIDTILKNSKRPPIIVLASDHGAASDLSPKEFGQTDPTKLNTKGVIERLSNLNTYYFPDHDYSKLYPSITPVNTFRVILDQFFGQNLKLLPDKVYLSDNNANYYRFMDVTNLVDK